MIQNETERAASFGVAAANVGAKKLGRRAILLGVPGRPAGAEVTVGEAFRAAFFVIGPQGRVLGPDFRFRQAAIQEEKLRFQDWVSVIVGGNLVGGEIARTGQDGKKKAFGEMVGLDL